MQHPRAKTYKVLGHLARVPFRQVLQVYDRGMSIDQQKQQLESQVHEWHRSLESVLSDRKSIDAFRLWLKIQRKDDALDLYLAIIAFRRHARRNDQRASSVAFGICRRYISPRTGICDFLPIQIRNDLNNRISNLRTTNHRPPEILFDGVAPLVWAYLCEQHALFVCSKEFAAVLKSAEQGNFQLRMAELAAARNATANSRIPPLIGFAKYKMKENGGTQRNSRPRSEPPGRRNQRSHVNGEFVKKDVENVDDQNATEQSFPMIRHDRQEDREMFVQMICERLAGFNTNEPLEKSERKSERQIHEVKAEIERETDLTSDNDNEQRLIQKANDYSDDEIEDPEDYREPWDDGENSIPLELLCDWSVNTSARVASTRGGPLFRDPKTSERMPVQSFMHKSASIGFSDVLDRCNDGSEARDGFPDFHHSNYNNTFPNEAPFIRNQLYAVHKHLVAPLSNKYAYHHVSRDRFPPPPPAPNRPEKGQLHNSTYQQHFSDSSGFCSSESAHFQFADPEPRRHYWMGSRMTRDNSFPVEGSHYGHTNVPNFRSPPSKNGQQLVVSYKDDVTGVPFVAKLEPRPLVFRDFRKCFGIPANTNKRFLFKSECDDGSASHQWNVIIDDLSLLPVFEGKIMAECRSFEAD